MGGDPAIVDDLPNEDGVPNPAPDGEQVDNHDILTGTNDKGQLFGMDWSTTCHDWTSVVGTDGRPRVGHSWPRDFGGFGMGGFPFGDGGFPFGDGGFPFPGGDGGFPFPGGGMGTSGFNPGELGMIDGANWMSSLNEAGRAPGATLIEMGPPNTNNPTVGSGGGYGGIYCFALQP
jgi:hypothetical protein